MAKQNYLKLAVVIVLTMAAASTAFAAAGQVGASIGGSSFTASNKVSCFYEGSSDGLVYAIACGHQAGDKIIAAKSGDPMLYFKSTGVGQAIAGASAIAVGFSTDGWTSM